ncbi:hypothetical protein TRFO_06290 [Tritrichomonas foetus]|uniref:Peptidase M60 domain-containing protein n=1 Tax=Tritrichomonas foetus TaxID=1144522 RepID=A0A1J4K0D6_9EUKA|nr:hypothetical protein TRFO_06290 [Tritrichomonas foetus]|eukprot:OHT04410.1 hypothetical protein TRFO_06290 [Tritrichomonas foetus]
MGCVFSSPHQTQAVRRARPQTTFEFYDEENPPPPPPPLELGEQLLLDTTNILNGLSQIYAPEDLVPVICFTEYSHPLFITSFSFDDQSDPIYLPIICFSRFGQGRFVFLGSLDFLTHTILHHTETTAFIENMITWGTDYKTQTIRIMILGFSPTLVSTLQGDFSSYGYILDTPKEVPTKITASLVFIASNYECENIGTTLVDYVKNGGTCIVFAVKSDKYPINYCLEESGLAFAVCTLKSKGSVIPMSNMEKIHSCLFTEVTKRYTDLLDNCQSKDDIDLSELDSCVSTLRYYVNGMGSVNAEHALALANKSYEFLQKKKNDEDEELICPDVIHSIITKKIMELIPKIAPESLVPAPRVDRFPGNAGKNIKLSNVKIRLSVKADIWNQTGVYIPPGMVAGITCDSSITLQIGCHALCLLLKPGPWKRWPTIVTRIPIDANKTAKVASPYGGIVYILTEKSKTITIVLSNVARHPYFVEGKHQIWEQTKGNEIPWGELLFKNICLTLPTKYMKTIRDISAFGASLDKLVDDINQFIGQKSVDSKKVVFDIDLPKNDPAVIGDCIFMNMEALESILYIHEASTEINQLLTYVCLFSIHCAFFDTEVELTISTLAACHAIKNSWPDEPTLATVSGTPPKIFYDLWDLYNEKGFQPFANAIQLLLNNKNLSNAGEAWIFFIQKLGESCERNLKHLTDRFGQAGQLSLASSDKLHVYQLDEGEI